MYLNIFRHRKRADIDMTAYLYDAIRMEKLACEQPGFIAYRRYSSQDGESLSVSEWESEADAQAWLRHAEHLAVQSRARASYYDSYVIYSCRNPEVRGFGENGAGDARLS